MYIDSVVISGLIIVVLTCAVLYYVGRYAYRHIKQDIAKSEEQKHMSHTDGPRQ